MAGEVKKVLTTETGLQPGEQLVIFRGKERENGKYLDVCGVKDRSKIILMEDPSSIERRFIEMCRNAKIQNANRAILDVSTEVDKLAEQVSQLARTNLHLFCNILNALALKGRYHMFRDWLRGGVLSEYEPFSWFGC